MKFQVISLMPEMILSGLKEGVVAQSIERKLVSIECLNPRKFTSDVHQSIDDRPYGGGDGMIMMAEPLEQAIDYFRKQQEEPGEFIYLSARGEVFHDQMARDFAKRKTMSLICGRYGGVDQRVLAKNKVREISIGDYILSGGELAALVLIDAIARHLPGVLGNKESAEQDSFAQGLLEAPSFTRTRNWSDLETPEVLLSGDHKKTAEWRSFVSLISTIQMREDLFLKKDLKLQILKAAKNFFEKMPKSERFVCGLIDEQRILQTLDDAILRAGT